jgi:hypothetical protein
MSLPGALGIACLGATDGSGSGSSSLALSSLNKIVRRWYTCSTPVRRSDMVSCLYNHSSHIFPGVSPRVIMQIVPMFMSAILLLFIHAENKICTMLVNEGDRLWT